MKKGRFYIMLVMVTMIAGCAGNVTTLGVDNGRLIPCPDSPNCVNSQAAAGDKHFIPAIEYKCTRAQARQRLLEIIRDTGRTRVITSADDYIRAEYTSRIFRFVDDVEFYFPPEPVIHVRSASRLGYSDLGANRKRIERIRERFSGADD